MTSSNGNIFRATGHLCGEFTVPGEFPAQKPGTRSFNVFFDLHLNKRLSKQSSGCWFETLSRPLWRHCNDIVAEHVENMAEHSEYTDNIDNLFGSILFQVMAWRRQARSHYLSQFWIIVSRIIGTKSTKSQLRYTLWTNICRLRNIDHFQGIKGWIIWFSKANTFSLELSWSNGLIYLTFVPMLASRRR